jgi:hypothetical protein
MRAPIWFTMRAWWGPKRPTKASWSRAILLRRRPVASSGRSSGSRTPATRAASIARPQTPRMSLATHDSSGAGVLQQVLQALGLAGAFVGDGLAVAGRGCAAPGWVGVARSWGGPARGRPAGRSRRRRRRRSCGRGRCGGGGRCASQQSIVVSSRSDTAFQLGAGRLHAHHPHLLAGQPLVRGGQTLGGGLQRAGALLALPVGARGPHPGSDRLLWTSSPAQRSMS